MPLKGTALPAMKVQGGRWVEDSGGCLGVDSVVEAPGSLWRPVSRGQATRGCLWFGQRAEAPGSL